jgi:hypothetical protein
VRDVVLNPMNSSADRFRGDVASPGEVFVNTGKARQHPGALESETGHAEGVEQLGSYPRPGITRDGDVINFAYGQARFGKAVTDGVCGEAGCIFHAVKAFFLDSGYQPSVAHKRSRRIGVISVNAKNIHVIYRISDFRF